MSGLICPFSLKTSCRSNTLNAPWGNDFREYTVESWTLDCRNSVERLPCSLATLTPLQIWLVSPLCAPMCPELCCDRCYDLLTGSFSRPWDTVGVEQKFVEESTGGRKAGRKGGILNFTCHPHRKASSNQPSSLSLPALFFLVALFAMQILLHMYTVTCLL